MAVLCVTPTLLDGPMATRPTLKDVASEAEVHVSTASRALNPETQSVVSGATVDRVLAAAEKLGYRPHPIARSLRTNETMSIGVVIPDVENPLFAPILAGIESSLIDEGYSMLIGNADRGEDHEAAVAADLLDRQVDGLILATARRHDPVIDKLATSGTPFVLVNRRTSHDQHPAIVGDDKAGIDLVVDHLVELGHTAIGHIAGPSSMSTGYGRRVAFEDRIRQHGLKVIVEEATGFKVDPGVSAVNRLLERNPDITALCAGNDLLAMGAYRASLAAGRTVGTDIAVTGYNDMRFLDLMHPPLTAVHVGYRQMGARAADLLVEILEGGEAPGSVLLEPSLSIRASTVPTLG